MLRDPSVTESLIPFLKFPWWFYVLSPAKHFLWCLHVNYSSSSSWDVQILPVLHQLLERNIINEPICSLALGLSWTEHKFCATEPGRVVCLMSVWTDLGICLWGKKNVGTVHKLNITQELTIKRICHVKYWLQISNPLTLLMMPLKACNIQFPDFFGGFQPSALHPISVMCAQTGSGRQTDLWRKFHYLSHKTLQLLRQYVEDNIHPGRQNTGMNLRHLDASKQFWYFCSLQNSSFCCWQWRQANKFYCLCQHFSQPSIFTLAVLWYRLFSISSGHNTSSQGFLVNCSWPFLLTEA